LIDLSRFLPRWLSPRDAGPGGARAATIDDEHWQHLCRQGPLLARFEPGERERLRALAERFLAEKEFRGAVGLEPSAWMCALVATHACVPVLELGLEWYRGWVTVILYPGAFVARHEHVDEDGVVHDVASPLDGESWEHGPVVLAWEEALAAARGIDHGHVVIHEFAHKLDMLADGPNGMPPLHADMPREDWTRAFSEAFAALDGRIEADEPSCLDDYAAEDPGEFFAVACEVFFTDPEALAAEYPAVYGQLARFFRQDPRARRPAARRPALGAR